MSGVFSEYEEKEKMMENLVKSLQESINTESYRLINSKHNTILNCSDNEYYNKINFENNGLIYDESIKDSKSSFMNKKRKRNNPSVKSNNSQNISEQKKLKEIEENILKDKVTLNMDKNELKKGIIKLDNDKKNCQTKYNSLNLDTQAALRDNHKKLEEFLNEETYIKTQILENENIIKPPDAPNKVDNNIKLKDFNNYSFKCLTKNLNFTIKKGISEATFKLIFENDGEFPWPKHKTILITNESKSNLKIEPILMKPINPRCQYTFDIKFRNMNKIQEGKYFSYLNFLVEGKKKGDSILINVMVKK
jgi:hypothetical protein